MVKDTSENKLSSEPISIDTAKPNLDNLGRAYATGRRKTSVSRYGLNMELERSLLTANLSMNIF